MERHSDTSKQEGLLESLEDLVNSQGVDKKYTGSFLGFCARLLSVKPKVDAAFRQSLEQDLLKRHPAYLAKDVEAPLGSAFHVLGNRLRGMASIAKGELLTMKPLKRLAFGSVPALAIVLAVIIAIGNPRVDSARAIEILKNDPQISAVIEAYDLRVQYVKMKGNLGYIFLDRDPGFDDVEATIVVDLSRETVWKIVAQEGKILSKSEITDYLDGKETRWAEKERELSAEAERQGMTFKQYLTDIKKESAVAFERQAAAKGMTIEEYKAYLGDEKAAEVEAYLAEFEAKAESMGMTPEEYKAYLVEEKSAKGRAYPADGEQANGRDL